MRCETVRELISADLDGEITDEERAGLDAHRGSCEACTAYSIVVADLHRSVRISPAAPVPDLTDAILTGAGVSPQHAPTPSRAVRRSRRTARSVLALQYGLLVVALTIAVLAIPELLAPSGADAHAFRHLGGWDLAFAVGLVLAALQPWRARGLVPMAAALAGVMVVTAVVDVADGATPRLAEASHLLELFGLVFLWLLSRTDPGRRAGTDAIPAPIFGAGGRLDPGRLLGGRATWSRSRPDAGTTPVAPVVASELDPAARRAA